MACNYQSHNSRPQNAAGNCAYCHGTGWKNVTFESGGQTYSGMKKCECQAAKPGGFQQIGSLPDLQIESMGKSENLSMLNSTDRKIARLIEERKGQENAITIETICKDCWPAEWSGYPAGNGEEQRIRNGLVRSVKATVEKLRMLARMPIAATKRPPYGYYIPVTAEECDEVYRRLFGEGVKLIMVARLFRPEADVVAELRGQLKF